MANTADKKMLGILLTEDAHTLLDQLWAFAQERTFPVPGKSDYVEMLIRAEAQRQRLSIPSRAKRAIKKRPR